jgi:hypothetical protein
MSDLDNDERLFNRLNRLAVAANSMTAANDRRLLLAMESELNALKALLHRQGDLLAQQLNAASAQINAVSAYARCAVLGHGSSDDRNPRQRSK